MRLTFALTILSAAAVASGSILRNVETNLCLRYDPFCLRLFMWSCDNIINGDWNIVTTSDGFVKIETTVRGETMCVRNDETSEEHSLEKCDNRHTTFLLEPGTESDVWSFHIRRRVLAVEGSQESEVQPRLLYEEALYDRPGAYEWSTKPQKTIYQELYAWLRYQGR